MELRKDLELSPGTWNLWSTGKRRVLFACPLCGDVGLISQEIGDDGVVSQAVQCPRLMCPFNETLKLLGWEPEKDEGLETKVFGGS